MSRIPALLAAALAAGCTAAPDSSSGKAAVEPKSNGPSCNAAHANAVSQLRREGRYMVDEKNRIVLLHGMNGVWKLKPYYPPNTPAGFTEADAEWLQAHGFNSMRLGVLFTGVMPEQDRIDTNYLANVDRVVQLLASHGIYVLFDFHQDIYNERFGGEGFPDWAVYDDGLPATNIGFPQTYFTPTVSHVFDNLWLNDNGIWDRYRDAWAAVAKKWHNQDHHGGYDLFNEPYPGSQFASCANPGGCPAFDTQFLQPMQEHAMSGIRTVDKNNLVFFEPNFVFNGGAQTFLGAVSPIDDPNIGLSWHKYCLLGVILHSQGFTDLPGCPEMHQLVSMNAESAVQRLNSTTLVTEFGASDDLADLQTVMDQTDAQLTGWQYWAYKEWADPTTESQTSGGQGMFTDDKDLSTVKVDKLKILERPYPQATAGVPASMSFDASTETFTYAYTPRCAGGPTDIYVPALHYPKGYNVEVTGAHVISPPGAAHLLLQNDSAPTATVSAGGAIQGTLLVTVKITPN